MLVAHPVLKLVAKPSHALVALPLNVVHVAGHLLQLCWALVQQRSVTLPELIQEDANGATVVNQVVEVEHEQVLLPFP